MIAPQGKSGYEPRRGGDSVIKADYGPRGRHGYGPRRGEEVPLGRFGPSGKFGRMFPDLFPLVADIDALDELGNAMLDADSSADNDAIPAGYTYLGQFIDHDITFDPTALQEILVDPLALANFRTPMLDLDSVYGSGPVAQPFLYERGDVPRMHIGKTIPVPGTGRFSAPGEHPNDLPRATHGFALIGDPRNDENLIVAQTHLAFLKLHNKVLEGILDGSIPQTSPIRKTPFEEARDLVIWHYQWIVLNDFLGRICDPDELSRFWDLKSKEYRGGAERRVLPTDREAFIPVEFSGAAYRFGHSMVRQTYDYNRIFTQATFDLIFKFTGLSGDGNDVPIPSNWIIDWGRFYEVSGKKPGLSRLIDPLLASELHNLPGGQTPSSLAARNLRRGRMLGLPPGQSIARFLSYEPLTTDDLSTGPDGEVAAKHNLHIETPLWYYVLKEAQVQAKGKHLGKVGSRIVAEVFIRLLESDSSSFIARNPEWKPTLPSATAGEYTMADLLTFVGDINPIGDAPADGGGAEGGGGTPGAGG